MVSFLCVTCLSVLAFFVLDTIDAADAFLVLIPEVTSIVKYIVEFRGLQY